MLAYQIKASSNEYVDSTASLLHNLERSSRTPCLQIFKLIHNTAIALVAAGGIGGTGHPIKI
jgi:hypothetical protein